MMKKRPGTKCIKEFSKDEPVVSMLEFQNRIYIATVKRVFVVTHIDGKDVLIPMEILVKE